LSFGIAQGQQFWVFALAFWWSDKLTQITTHSASDTNNALWIAVFAIMNSGQSFSKFAIYNSAVRSMNKIVDLTENPQYLKTSQDGQNNIEEFGDIEFRNIKFRY